jgi:hypothetical protein
LQLPAGGGSQGGKDGLELAALGARVEDQCGHDLIGGRVIQRVCEVQQGLVDWFATQHASDELPQRWCDERVGGGGGGRQGLGEGRAGCDGVAQ